MDVFISWTRADEDVKNAIAERLSELNISYFDSDENCTSDFSEECIAEVKKCSVFIVIISEAAMAGGYVKNEVITARKCEDLGQLNILVYKVTDQPYTNGFEFNLNHISHVTGNLIQRKEEVIGESGIDRIIKRAVKLLDRRREGDPEKPYDVNTPIVDGLALTDTGYFVENSRDLAFQEIDKAFERSNVIVLKEMFGFGKRSTVKKYLELRSSTFKTKVMPDNDADLYGFFLSHLGFSNVNSAVFENLEGDALIKRKFEFLAKLDETTVIIIPDLKTNSEPDRAICERLKALKCKVILLTQESTDLLDDFFPVVNLGRMADEHLFELFFHHYKYAGEDDREGLMQPLATFFDNIGGHTRTVELTALALARDFGAHPEEIPNYLRLHGTEGAQLKDRILNQIESLFNLESLTEEERIVLQVAAYVAVPNISEKKFLEILSSCGVQNRAAVMSLSHRRWIDVDIVNRSVSVEPIISEIILKKCARDFVLLYNCFYHIYSGLSSKAFFQGIEKLGISGYGKLERILEHAGYELEASLCGMLKQITVSNDNNCNRDELKAAIEEYKTLHPNNVDDGSDEYGEYDESAEYADETDCVDEYDDEYTNETDGEEYIEIPVEELFSQTVEEFIRAFILPVSLVTSNLAKVAANFAATGDFYDNMIDSIDLESTIGMSEDELTAYLEFMQEQFQNSDEFDEDDARSIIIMEGIAFIYDFINRQRHTLFEHMNAILECVEEFPEVLEDKVCAEMTGNVLNMICTGFNNAGASHSTVNLLEKVFKKVPELEQSPELLPAYLNALSHQAIYTEQLYTAYERLIDYLKASQETNFDNLSDAKQIQKSWILDYAIDLAYGGQVERAVSQFEAAQKLTPVALTDITVHTANIVVNALINYGDLSGAVGFINKHFPSEFMKICAANGTAETLAHLENFEALLAIDETPFEEDEDIGYSDYYSSYSRQSNPFAERKYREVADKALTYDFSSLTDSEISAHAKALKEKAKTHRPWSLISEAFALVSEAGKRTLGFKHHHVQYIGAAAMSDGKIAEMLNGEGKTYTIVLVAFYHYICGRQAIIIDNSGILTDRNCNWMRDVYKMLGLSVGKLLEHNLFDKTMVDTRHDVVYAKLKPMVTGYLCNETSCYAKPFNIDSCSLIIDEADFTLIDEAPKPVDIITREDQRNTVDEHAKAYELVNSLDNCDEYYDFEHGNVTLKPKLYDLIEKTFRVNYLDIKNVGLLKDIEYIVISAIKCREYYKSGDGYTIVNGVPSFEDLNTGVYMPFRETYQYFILRQENLNVDRVVSKLFEYETTNTITLRDFFRKFYSLCGTTATAISFEKEFKELYGLEYIAIPTNKPCVRTVYQTPVFTTLESKMNEIVALVQEKFETGQPVLLVTKDVDESLDVSEALTEANIPHKLVNADNALDLNKTVASAGKIGSIFVSTSLVNRGVDIKLGGDPELQTRRELVGLGIDTSELTRFINAKFTPKMAETELFKKYRSILEKNRLLAAEERRRVLELGGLCVIGTSFFGEKRTEQQTLGRSGRQGEVGECYLFRSYQDKDLLRLLPEKYSRLMSSMDTEVDYKSIRYLFNIAQRRLHDFDFKNIRQCNDRHIFIDEARPDFIGRKRLVMSGDLKSHDVLRWWAESTRTRSDLEALINGEEVKDKQFLKSVFKNNREAFERTPKRRYTKVLLDAACRSLFDDKEDLKSEVFNITLIHELVSAWSHYIKIVRNVTKNTDASPRSIRDDLEPEKLRILMEAVDKACQKTSEAQVKPPVPLS